MDRVTIMRDGKHIMSSDFADLSMEQIIGHMVGREIKEQFPRIESRPGGKQFLRSRRLMQVEWFGIFPFRLTKEKSWALPD